MTAYPIGQIFEVIYRSLRRSIPQRLILADDLLPNKQKKNRNPDKLFDLLLKDGWMIENMDRKVVATFIQGNVAARFWYYGLDCDTLYDVRLGLFRPWEYDHHHHYRVGYLDAIELALSIPSDARFGNGRPVCLIGFTSEASAWIAYWEDSLMHNQDHLPRGKHGDDEKTLLHILRSLGSDNIRHNKDSFAEPGDRLLRDFNWPQQEAK